VSPCSSLPPELPHLAARELQDHERAVHGADLASPPDGQGEHIPRLQPGDVDAGDGREGQDLGLARIPWPVLSLGRRLQDRPVAAVAMAAVWWGRLSIVQVETTASAVAEVALKGDEQTLMSFMTGGRR